MAAYNRDLASVGGVTPAYITISQPASSVAGGSAPSAQAAARVAFGKGIVERPMLNSFQEPDDADWAKIAALHQDDAALDNGAQKLIRGKNPTAVEAGRVAMTKYQAEDPLVSTLRNLQRSIAEDTVRNEYDLHTKIHQWFMNGTAPTDPKPAQFQGLCRTVPDPGIRSWLGLVPANTFTGLDDNGLVQTTKKP